MNVKELIDILRAFPLDLPVVVDNEILTKENIYIKNEYYNGDGANPYCEIIDEVLCIE